MTARVGMSVLTFPQKLALATWLTTNHEAGELDYKTIADITEKINTNAKLGFEVSPSNVQGLASQLSLSWPRRRASRPHSTTVQLAPEELLCIIDGICEIARRLPSMQIDPDHCLERIRDRVLATITEPPTVDEPDQPTE